MSKQWTISNQLQLDWFGFGNLILLVFLNLPKRHLLHLLLEPFFQN